MGVIEQNCPENISKRLKCIVQIKWWKRGYCLIYVVFKWYKNTRRNKTKVLINIKCADVYGITDDVDLIFGH